MVRNFHPLRRFNENASLIQLFYSTQLRLDPLKSLSLRQIKLKMRPKKKVKLKFWIFLTGISRMKRIKKHGSLIRFMILFKLQTITNDARLTDFGHGFERYWPLAIPLSIGGYPMDHRIWYSKSFAWVLFHILSLWIPVIWIFTLNKSLIEM